jgi:cytochrome c oxidase cbb3-type subunit 4
MDALMEFHGWLSALWVVWFFALFVGILVWALRPSKRREFDRAAQIPFHDDRI